MKGYVPLSHLLPLLRRTVQRVTNGERRHHCRLCGLLFCGRCSGGRVSLLGWGELAPTPTGLGARAIHSFRDLFIVS